MRTEEEIRAQLAKFEKKNYSPQSLKNQIQVKVNGYKPGTIWAFLERDDNKLIRKQVHVWTQIKGVKKIYIQALKWVLNEEE